MSAGRRRRDVLAGKHAREHYPAHPDLVEATCECLLRPVSWSSEPVSEANCGAPSQHCAQMKITGHEDYKTPTRIFKPWHFPQHAVRLSYTNGPRSDLHSPGVGIAFDVDRLVSGRFLIEARYWDQGGDIKSNDPGSCVLDCRQRRGWGGALQFEQPLSNFFGLYGGLRYFLGDEEDSVPASCTHVKTRAGRGGCAAIEHAETGDDGLDERSQVWFAFGPMVEFTIPALTRGRWGVGNFVIQGGLALQPTSSPRFEFRVNVGVWRWGRSTSFGT